MTAIPHVLRAAEPGDEAFIMKTWLLSHRENGDWPHRLPTPRCIRPERCACCRFSSRRYFDEHKLVVADLLKRSQTIVAVNPNRTTQILGFVTFEPTTAKAPGALHWVDVKKVYRRNGLGSVLLHAVGIGGDPGINGSLCSHWTIGARNLAARNFALSYDPFILGAPKE